MSRNLLRTLELVLALAAAAPPLIAPARAACPGPICWTPRGSYAGQEFTTLVSVPGNPCVVAWTALSNGGLGVSTDCGSQYARLFLLSAHDVTAKNENVGYVAAGTVGIAKSVDGGGNWFQVNAGLPASPDARALAIHVATPESLTCGLYNGGVFVGGPVGGADSLTQWTSLNQGLGDLTVRALARVRGGTFLLAATNSGIWRRAAGNWSLVAPGVVANALVIDAADSSRCYAACETGLYRSLSQGLSWSASNTGLPGVPLNDVSRRTDVANVLYVGTRGQGVWESVDSGASWRRFGPDLPGDNDVRAVLCTVGALSATGAQVFAGTRADGLFEATYSTPALPSTWGRIKDAYRR